MNHFSNRRQLVEKIRTVLLRDWDPLGIGENPCLRDEYDSYLPELLRILNAPSVSREAIMAYLKAVETDQMGLTEDLKCIAISAQNLVDLVRGGVHRRHA